jgi:hypothetical protein
MPAAALFAEMLLEALQLQHRPSSDANCSVCEIAAAEAAAA